MSHETKVKSEFSLSTSAVGKIFSDLSVEWEPNTEVDLASIVHGKMNFAFLW